MGTAEMHIITKINEVNVGIRVFLSERLPQRSRIQGGKNGRHRLCIRTRGTDRGRSSRGRRRMGVVVVVARLSRLSSNSQSRFACKHSLNLLVQTPRVEGRGEIVATALLAKGRAQRQSWVRPF